MEKKPNDLTKKLNRKTLKQHRFLKEKMGPEPGASLRAMRGYGLNDREIANYFGMTPSSLNRLKLLLQKDIRQTDRL